MTAKFEITDEIKHQVKECAQAGFNLKHVAAVIGCSLATIKLKHELLEIYCRAKYIVLKKIGKSAFQKALDGDSKMMIFLLKTQLNFSEQTYVKLSDFAGKPYSEQKLLVEKMLEAGEISVENYEKLLKALTAAYETSSLADRIAITEEKLGLEDSDR